MTIEYVSGAELCLVNDVFYVSVVNSGGVVGDARILVNMQVASPPIFGGSWSELLAFAWAPINPGEVVWFGIGILNIQHYWIQIFVNSADIVPSARLERPLNGGTVAVASYGPNDFAKFDRNRT
jgi:hypothetical protein